jgi:hypothetical protein
MKLFVPRYGTKLRLIDDWRFTLHFSRENYDLFDALKLPPRDPHVVSYNGSPSRWSNGYDENDPYGVIIPAGTVLKVERINVRRSMYDDDIAFSVVDSPEPRLKTKRKGGTLDSVLKFFPPLEETQTIECEVV